MNITNFIEAMESYMIDFEKVIESSNLISPYVIDDVIKLDNTHGNERKYPVYVILYGGSTLLSATIKKLTRSRFSHASISFDLSMQYIFSFGDHDCEINKNKRGLKIERFDNSDPTITDLTEYRVYVTFVTEDEYNKMKNTLNSFVEKQSIMKFNLFGLARQIFNIEHEDSTKMFCSQFVATILKSGNEDIISSRTSLTKPSDFTQFDNFYRVCGGYVGDYDRKYAERKVKEIYKKKILNE